jgi:hypothetical protein
MKLSGIGESVLATYVALLLTAAAVGAAIEPARAIQSVPISLVETGVSGQALV